MSHEKTKMKDLKKKEVQMKVATENGFIEADKLGKVESDSVIMGEVLYTPEHAATQRCKSYFMMMKR